MAAAANQDVGPIKAMHHEVSLRFRDREMAQLEEHLMWQNKFMTDNSDVTEAECLFANDVCHIIKHNKVDGKGIYAIKLKKDGMFYRTIINSNKP